MKSLVVSYNPQEYMFAPPETRLQHARNVVRWYDYVRRLQERGKIESVWSGLPFSISPIAKGAAVVIYNHESLDELQELLSEDPVYEQSVVQVTLLAAMEDDEERDKKRVEELEKVVRSKS